MELQTIQNLSLDALKNVYQASIPAQLALPAAFWELYSNSEKKLATGLRACLAIWAASGKEIVPVEFQLRATIAVMSGQDTLVDVGTGYGKTLCMIIPCLLDAPGTISIIISPLNNRLQAAQVLEFERYGIQTMAINEDTPNDPKLWKDIRDGKFSALVLQPEQLSMMANHLPRLARLISEDRQFRKRIVRVHVDEAHFIHTAGRGLYGLVASRPAWGKLGELRVMLGKSVVFQALSGTQPQHIKKTIIEQLLFHEENICHIKLSSNRPNMLYATHPIVGDLSDFRNLDFLIPDPTTIPADLQLPKTLVFHDNIYECASAAAYINDRLPKALCGKGVVQHYHAWMSKRYLAKVYEEFSKPDSTCRILHVTEEAYMELDISDIEVVIQYGVPRDVPTALQRSGHGGRSKTGQAIFLIMYEPWVMDIDLSVVDVTLAVSDPDHPTVAKLSKTSNKKERTGMAMIKIIQSKDCPRGMYAQYFGDESPDALQYTTPWCCNRHADSDFHIHHFFKGRLLYQDAETGYLFYGAQDESDRTKILPPPKEKRKAQDKQRTPDERKSLASRFFAWRYQEHANSPLAPVLSLSSILDDASINTLSKLHPEHITDYRQIRDLLDQTTEWEESWSKKIFDIIRQFDQDLADCRQTAATQTETRQKRAKVAQDCISFEEATKENEVYEQAMSIM